MASNGAGMQLLSYLLWKFLWMA